jgi:serine/threonine protein kinase
VNGEVLAGRYRLLSLLGRGGAGEVWRADDQVLARPVAVKMLRRLEGDPMDAVERFRIEARAAARLTHPNVVATYDVGAADGQVFLVMELVNGPDLAQLLRSGGLPAAKVVAGIAQQGARALDAAHAAGVVHRDIKPGNLLLAPDGTLKMTDFGIAQAVGLDGATGPVLLGTAAYVSPEQVRGQRATPASDWYSFGCVLYELLEGRPPFTGTDATDVLHQHLEATPAPVRRDEGVPGLAGLVMSLLAKDPAARPSSATAIATYLDPTPAAPSMDDGTRVLPFLPLTTSPSMDEAVPVDELALAAAGDVSAAEPDVPDASHSTHSRRSVRRFPFGKVIVGLAVAVAAIAGAALLREGVADPTAEAGGVPTPPAATKSTVKPTPSVTPSKKTPTPTPKKTPKSTPAFPQMGTEATLRLLAGMLRQGQQGNGQQGRGARAAREAANDLDEAADALADGDTDQAAGKYQDAKQRLAQAQRENRWEPTPQVVALFTILDPALGVNGQNGNNE